MSETTVERRLVPDRLDQPLWRRLMRWETLLAAIAIAIFALNSVASPYFLDPYALSDLTFTFTEKGLIALPMALLIISGEFDLSVAAIMALASTLMGMAAEAGAGTPLLVIIGVLVGLICGAGNGLLVAYFRLPSIVAHHRHDEPVPRHRFHHSRRSGLWKISGRSGVFRTRLRLERHILRTRALCCSGDRLWLRAAWHELWATHLCHWREFRGRSLFGRSGRTDQVSALLLDRSHVGRRGRAHHIAPRFDAAVDRARVRARRDHHGGAWEASASRAGQGPFRASCSRRALWDW